MRARLSLSSPMCLSTHTLFLPINTLLVSRLSISKRVNGQDPLLLQDSRVSFCPSWEAPGKPWMTCSGGWSRQGADSSSCLPAQNSPVVCLLLRFRAFHVLAVCIHSHAVGASLSLPCEVDSWLSVHRKTLNMKLVWKRKVLYKPRNRASEIMTSGVRSVFRSWLSLLSSCVIWGKLLSHSTLPHL